MTLIAKFITAACVCFIYWVALQLLQSSDIRDFRLGLIVISVYSSIGLYLAIRFIYRLLCKRLSPTK